MKHLIFETEEKNKSNVLKGKKMTDLTRCGVKGLQSKGSTKKTWCFLKQMRDVMAVCESCHLLLSKQKKKTKSLN